MALTDYKITSTDEQGKLHTGQPKDLADIFNTYQEVQAFMDSHGQMIKDKFNALIDSLVAEFLLKQNKTDNALNTTAKTIVGAINENRANVEQKADKQYKSAYFNTIGWKRVANGSLAGSTGLIGQFTINNLFANSAPTVAQFNVIQNYNARLSIIQTNSDLGAYNTITKARVVYSADSSKGYFFEIYYNKAVSNSVNVTLENNTGWNLITPTDGEIPSGYSVLEVDIVDKNMAINGKPVATTDKIDILLPLGTGVSVANNMDTISKTNNLVALAISVKKTDNSDITTEFTVGTLPAGYRPTKNLIVYGALSNAEWSTKQLAYFYISTAGTILCRNDTGVTGMKVATLNVSYFTS